MNERKVRKLITKWRERESEARESFPDAADACMDCADELEQALAGEAEEQERAPKPFRPLTGEKLAALTSSRFALPKSSLTPEYFDRLAAAINRWIQGDES